MPDIRETRRRFTIAVALLAFLCVAAVAVLISPIGRGARSGERQIADLQHTLGTKTREVAGAVHVALYPILESDDAAQILGVVVSAAQQRLGIGRALMERAERWARERHCTTVYLRANVLRTDAHSFYARLGYLNDRTQFAFQKKLPH